MGVTGRGFTDSDERPANWPTRERREEEESLNSFLLLYF